jgi:hypothetical protein
MASPNQDVVVLVTARLDDGRLLVVRHLPDRGTVAVGWWGPDENGAVAPGPSGLELVAEAVGVDAVARLGPGLAAAGWAPAEEGRTVAVTPSATDGAKVLAVRAGDGLRLVRQPEGGNLTLPFPATLALLAATFPAAW